MGHDTLQTTEPGEVPEVLSAGGHRVASPRRKRFVAVAASLALILVAALVAVVATRDNDDETTTQASTTVTTEPEAEAAEPPPRPEPTPSTADTTSPPTGQPSALDALESFLAAAATMDDQLHRAATAINGSGPPFTTVTHDIASAVQAADLETVSAQIPAGLPADLLQQAILVYSELSSRRAAMADFGYPHTVPSDPIVAGSSQDLLEQLSHGHAAAERFDDDIAALRALASDTAPFTIAAPDSRAAAETRLQIATVDNHNGGCDSHGGHIATELAPITWSTDTTGTIGGTRFDATFGTNGEWDIQLYAC